VANNYQQLTIGALCDAGLAELQTGPFGSQLHAHDYVDAGIAVVPTEAIRDRQIDHTVLPKISAAKAQELARHRLRPGDILFARRGVQATGHIGYVRADEEGFICGTGAIRLRLTEHNAEVSGEFLSHVLANPTSVEWFKFHAIGATMPNLNEGIIRSFPLALPPPEDQQVIAAFLSAFDDKIESNRRMNETLEEMARAIFKDWFIDFGPTRANIEGRARYLAPEVWSLFPARLDDGGIPEGWEFAPVHDLIHFNPPERIERGQPAPYLDMAALPTLGSWPDAPIERAFSSGSKFRNGDAILARITPCLENGKAAFVQSLSEETVGWGSTEFIVMRAMPPMPAEYAYLIARDPAFKDRAIRSMTGTSGRQRVQVSSLNSFTVAKPGPALATAFGAIIAPYFSKIAANARQSEVLAATRDLLLPKLMSGEIRVRDAEKALNEVA
jgi:type I restriction enzyme S subunit